MFIDTHCHLNFPQFDIDRTLVIGNAKKAGVKKFINPGVDLFSSRQAIELAKKNPGVIFAAVGIHPYEAQHNHPTDDLEKLIALHNNSTNQQFSNLIVAIGECGLDYHQYKGEKALGKKDKQKILFEEQLRLALKYDLPVIIHCREAFEDFFNVIDGLPDLPKGVIHCFGGGLTDLRMAKERKFFIGIDGNVTYAKQLWLTVPQIPSEMMLLETDAPLLTPLPHRGTRNEPKYLPLIAKKIAGIKGVLVKNVELQTTQNAANLFKLDN